MGGSRESVSLFDALRFVLQRGQNLRSGNGLAKHREHLRAHSPSIILVQDLLSHKGLDTVLETGLREPTAGRNGD